MNSTILWCFCLLTWEKQSCCSTPEHSRPPRRRSPPGPRSPWAPGGPPPRTCSWLSAGSPSLSRTRWIWKHDFKFQIITEANHPPQLSFHLFTPLDIGDKLSLEISSVGIEVNKLDTSWIINVDSLKRRELCSTTHPAPPAQICSCRQPLEVWRTCTLSSTLTWTWCQWYGCPEYLLFYKKTNIWKHLFYLKEEPYNWE